LGDHLFSRINDTVFELSRLDPWEYPAEVLGNAPRRSGTAAGHRELAQRNLPPRLRLISNERLSKVRSGQTLGSIETRLGRARGGVSRGELFGKLAGNTPLLVVGWKPDPEAFHL